MPGCWFFILFLYPRIWLEALWKTILKNSVIIVSHHETATQSQNLLNTKQEC